MTTSAPGAGAPQPFPDWMLRRDGTLLAAETNPAYVAFRLRRTAHSGAAQRQAAAIFGNHLLIASILYFIALIGMTRVGMGMGTLPGLAMNVGFMILLAGLMLRRGNRSANDVPSFVREALPPNAQPRLLHDLALAGVSGRDVAEALYLESREAGATLLALSTRPFVAAALATIIMISEPAGWTATSLAGLLVSYAVVSVLFWRELSRDTALSAMQVQLAAWAPDLQGTKSRLVSYRRTYGMGALKMAVYGFGLVLWLPVLALGATVSVVAWLLGWIAYVMVANGVLALALAPRFESEYESLREAADEAFAVMVDRYRESGRAAA